MKLFNKKKYQALYYQYHFIEVGNSMIEDRVFVVKEHHQCQLYLKNIVAVFFLACLCLSAKMVSAQIIWAGVKAGGQVNFARLDNAEFRDTVRSLPTGGFNFGGALSFRVKDRYFLHAEYVYSLKQKLLKATGKFDPYLKDKMAYHYIEVPVLFTVQFKFFTGSEKNFKSYFGVGPNVAYLMGGQGTIRSGELMENGYDKLNYQIKLKERGPNREHIDDVHYPHVNRFQFGINVGAGIILEPQPKRKVIIDLRYTLDQTQFAKRSADYLVPHDYRDNLRFRNRTLRVSIMYMLQYNLDKKVRHKGKSSDPKSR